MAQKSDDAAPHPDAAVTDERVAAFLRDHPDFLMRNPELAAQLAAPARWPGGGTLVDLQHYMNQKLRRELDQMRGCAEHLITTTRSNMTTQQRTHKAVLAALCAPGMAELAVVVAEELPPLLEIDAAALSFETGTTALPALAAPGVGRLPAGAVAAAMGDREVVLCGSTAGDPAVFGAAAGLVQSFALARLRLADDQPQGLLALGSRAERTFVAGQATDLLSFLARVVEQAVRRWVSAA